MTLTKRQGIAEQFGIKLQLIKRQDARRQRRFRENRDPCFVVFFLEQRESSGFVLIRERLNVFSNCVTIKKELERRVSGIGDGGENPRDSPTPHPPFIKKARRERHTKGKFRTKGRKGSVSLTLYLCRDRSIIEGCGKTPSAVHCTFMTPCSDLIRFSIRLFSGTVTRRKR